MADIGGIGGFNLATTRSVFDTEAAAQRRTEEAQRQEALREEQRVEEAADEEAQVQEAAAEEEGASQAAQEDQEDTIVLSNAAQSFLVQAQDDAEAANDDGTVGGVGATGGVDAVVQTTQVGGVNGTNQQTADEENSSTVNGNQDQQSEQTRALGQLVDQFA
ncbi:hypothetical protein [Pacificispira sp.]|uniref:hypothetical protein n=1 Tax=Pacificispira sp. TaxID=2888761 RepID=UPI003BA9E620